MELIKSIADHIFKYFVKLETSLEAIIFDYGKLYSFSIGIIYIYISITSKWEKILENILISLVLGVFIAFVLAIIFGLSWLVVSLIVEILSNFKNNRLIYLEYLKQQNDKYQLKIDTDEESLKGSKINSLFLGVLLGWLLFGS